MDLRIPAQQIEIIHNPAPNCSRVSRELKVKFRDVYLREKKETDKDFVVTEKSMELLAFQVWDVQFRKALQATVSRPPMLNLVGPCDPVFLHDFMLSHTPTK
ncbi:uncharacterized protein N7487_005453 [Penicillium crustosum]|uniref:uncharacterized protein n=1 Tax=Penicillium crustosum TaxID=36656 RepID=UPI0023A2C728|nr:uncharacterized protein N7487_005453 [Penicillium crustosum]KAJ5411094.1 hypothetical protein N7487_005453 [Penicillium crustosum]